MVRSVRRLVAEGAFDWLDIGAWRGLASRLRTAGRADARRGAVAWRPWGRFEWLGGGARHKVKRLVLDAGAATSLQRHRHRSEHWVVVRGVAEVTRGDEVLRLGVDGGAYLPRGVVHRLRNPGEDVLEVIEVQVGDRLEEADIERLADRYGRSADG